MDTIQTKSSAIHGLSFAVSRLHWSAENSLRQHGLYESPPQWTGKMLKRITYDETQRRMFQSEERDYSTGQTQYIDKLKLYNENIEYRVDRRTRDCNVTVLNGPFRPYGVHPLAVFDHAFTIGAVGVSGEFMTLNHFFGKFEDGTTFDGTVSSPDCIPVELDYNGTWGFEHMTFYDLTLGIVDPMVFLPPSNCKNVEYRLDLKTRKCNVTTPRMPWRPLGVPPGSKFEGSAVIGAAGVSGEFITVNNFYGNFSDGFQFAGVVTSPDCVPIQLDFIGQNSIEHNTFYDIAPGITDPNAFIPPREITKTMGRTRRVSYDEDSTRIRIIEEEEIGSQREFYDTLYLHNIGKEYKINLKTRKCNVTALTRPFRPFGVPREAKFDGEATIGAAGVPGESLTVVNFNGTFSDDSSILILELQTLWHLFHHKSGLKYKLHIRTRSCTKNPLSGPFRYRGVPRGAQFMYENTIGAVGVPDEYVTVRTFNGTFPDNVRYVVTVTEPDCIPVHGFFMTTLIYHWSNPRDTFEVFEKISYDEENMRVRVLEFENGASGREFYDTLYLHNVGLEYKLNIRTRSCTKSTLTRPFRHRGVPPGAQFMYENTIGAVGVPDEYVTVSTFNATFPDNSRFVVTVTEPDCIPVHGFFMSNNTGPEFMDYFDITLGITDPMVDDQKNFQEYAKFWYDENNKRVRMVEEVEIGSTRDYYDILALFNLNKEYKVNLKTKQCVTSTISQPFIPMGVPREARFDFDAEIGAAGIPNEHLTIQAFSGNFTFGDLKGGNLYICVKKLLNKKLIKLWSEVKCIMIYCSIFLINFFDINIGIRDPNIWIPPSICPP
ncbi:hypothetical protein KUTeg_014239 [Tegillarca granosa]|uniref:Uncharacterized protein n=1 Tax=Tegillarca granosa TaxID=220873 RepID=A0ABQ9EVZ3_TEGGR|nr:hypothetical protein KUTeg_014239 [Tegillarca granosa]